LSKRDDIKSWRDTNGIGRKTVMIPWTKETNGGKGEGERKRERGRKRERERGDER
jgi:hypothetical protein